MKTFLSIIIPCFNEEMNFNNGSLKKIFDYLIKFGYSYEVIIVDDGSTDNSVKLIKEYIKDKKNCRLTSNTHQGKVGAISTGVKLAIGENILFTDFDQATPLSEIEKLLPFLNKNYDIIIGSREVKGAKREKEPFYRHIMGKVFNLVVQLFAFGGIHDTQCGFKLFKTAVAKDLFNRLQIYKQKKIKNAFTGAFDVELLYLAQKKGYQIAEVPVAWRHYETTRVNPIKDSAQMFIDVVKIRVYNLLGKYDNKN